LFDYVFVVGNHIYQKPIGFAPRLAASNRAAKYVRACMNGLMQIAWAKNGPKTRAAFHKTFPRGFGIVGRCDLVTAEATGADIIHGAVTNARHERLPIRRAERLAVIAPQTILDRPESELLLGTLANSSKNSVASIPSTDVRQAATLLAFGVKPTRRSAARTKEFGLEVLRSRGFLVERETSELTYGYFANIGSVVVGFSSSETLVDDTISRISRSRTKQKLILADYDPSPPLFKHCATKSIIIVHFSWLDECLSAHLSVSNISERRDRFRRSGRR
jgi:hypothetical protein